MDILGLDHVYLTVSDFERSCAFYDKVMKVFGFHKGDMSIVGQPHAHYFNRSIQISIRPARDGASAHDPYAPGLHHLCLQAAGEDDVREAAEALRELGIDATKPCLYPEYDPHYYATFFEDPDGLRLEIVARTPHRDEVVRRWEEFDTFLNPMTAKGKDHE